MSLPADWLLTALSAEVELTLDEAVSESDLFRSNLAFSAEAENIRTASRNKAKDTVHVCLSSVFLLCFGYSETRLDLWAITQWKKKQLMLKVTIWVLNLQLPGWFSHWLVGRLNSYLWLFFNTFFRRFTFIYTSHSWSFTNVHVLWMWRLQEWLHHLTKLPRRIPAS